MDGLLVVAVEYFVHGCCPYLTIVPCPVYITRGWLRQQVTLCCHPYDERHKSVNLAKWLLVRKVVYTNLMVGSAW